MNIEKLKEHKQHGDSMLPIALYPVNHKLPGDIMPHHWHNEFEFIYLSAGDAVFTIDDDVIPIKAGECIFVNSGQIHSGISKADHSSYFSLVFSPELLTNSIDSCQKFFNGIITKKMKLISHLISENPIHREVISELKEIIHELGEKNTAFELAIKSRLLSVFCLLVRNNLFLTQHEDPDRSFHSKKYDMLKRVLGYIDQNHNKKIRLIDVSKTVNLTPQYLCRIFKDLTGHNIVDYINRYRIDTASALLKISNLSVTDIALECGFDNISYFNRVFKKQTGHTPTEFRLNRKTFS